MRTAAAILLSLLIASTAATAQDADAFQQANALFMARDYAGAVRAYTAIAESGIENAALEYNLGCAYYRLGRVGPARLHFERAARLDPGDRDTRANLELIESRYIETSLREENFASPELLLRSALSMLPLGPALWIGAIAFLLLNALFALRNLAPEALHPAIFWTLLIAAAVVSSVAFSAACGHALLARGSNYGVIVAPDAGVASEPAGDAPSRFPAPEGTKVKVERQRDGWLEIVLPNNAKGWLPADDVEII